MGRKVPILDNSNLLPKSSIKGMLVLHHGFLFNLKIHMKDTNTHGWMGLNFFLPIFQTHQVSSITTQ
jgi:hypothetical protein